jgi:hypothetical protein
VTGVLNLTTQDRFAKADGGGSLRVLDNGREWVLQRYEKEDRRGPLKWADRGYFLSRSMLHNEASRGALGGRLNAEDGKAINGLPRHHPFKETWACGQ